MNGVLIVDKPQQFTSFDVVAVVRKLSGQRKIGHTGTLDPNATGVLALLLGNATKAQDIVPNHDKSYVADFRLGMTTDTLDIWGEVKTSKQTSVKREELEKILPEFKGEIEQIPPMFSAVSVGGQRLYDLARKGVEVERKSRKVRIYSLELEGFDEKTQSGTLSVSCSKGTYIRTLIDDIGQRLEAGAVMTGLRRTEACGFSLNQALTLDEVKKLAADGMLEEKLQSTESLFESYPRVFLTEAQARRFKNGGEISCLRTKLAEENLSGGEVFRVCSGKTFLGLGKIRGGSLWVFKQF